MSQQNDAGHHHHSAADSFFTGYAVGIIGAWLVRDSRHPARDLLFIVTAPLVPPFLVLILIGSAIFDPVGELPAPIDFVVACGGLALYAATFWAWLSVPATLDRRQDQRWWWQAVEAEQTYRDGYRAKLAEVATQAEMRQFGDQAWDRELSHDERASWSAVLERWCAANPSRFPSQDQFRSSGHLCRCEPASGHACHRTRPQVNLSAIERRGIPVEPTTLQRAVPRLNWSPHRLQEAGAGQPHRLPLERYWTTANKPWAETLVELRQANWRVFWWIMGVSALFSVGIIALSATGGR